MQTNHPSTINFSDLVSPGLHSREDLESASVTLDPIEEAAFDVILDADARGLTAAEWETLATTASDQRFAIALAALCRARANEARRIGGRHGR